MPALDKAHQAAKNALIKDGWTVTSDPLRLRYAGVDLYIDLAAEQVIAAEKGKRKIAVEIKMFAGKSDMRDLHNAVGQFVVYRDVLQKIEPDREMFLAVPETVRQDMFESGIGALVLESEIKRALSFDAETEEVVQWIMK